MATEPGMTDLERLVALEAIRTLKARRDHAVDRKEWGLYASLHTDDHVAESVGAVPLVGGRVVADQLAVALAGLPTVHHSHTPVIEFDGPERASGVWAMSDSLFWSRDGVAQWLRGFGFYHERYVRVNGAWLFCYRRLERTHVETSDGAAALRVDLSGENPYMAVSA